MLLVHRSTLVVCCKRVAWAGRRRLRTRFSGGQMRAGVLDVVKVQTAFVAVYGADARAACGRALADPVP